MFGKQKRDRFRLGWPVLGLVALSTLLLGAIGLYKTYDRQPLGPWDMVYNLLQLFKGDLQLPFVSAPFKDQLELRIARVLAPLVVLAATGKVFFGLLSHKLNAFVCRRLHGHVLICGAGHKGRLLAEQFLAKGEPAVVVLEVDPQNDALLELKAKGARVLIGNAADRMRMQLASAAHASRIFAVTRKDETNLEIAVEVALLRREAYSGKKRPARDLQILAHVASPQLRELFTRQPPFAQIEPEGRLEARLFDCTGTAARALVVREIQQLQCHRADSPGPCFLVCGQGHFVEELLRQLISVAHCGNERKPHLTVVTVDPNLKAVFERCYPQLSLVAEVRFLEVAHQRFAAEVLSSTLHGPVYDFAAVSLPNDVDTLEWAESLARLAHFKGPGARHSGGALQLKALYACLLPTSSLATLPTSNGFAATVVSLAQEGCNLEVLLNETLDQEARRLHANYLAGQLGPSVQRHSPLAVPWEQLPEFAREDNRSAALHNCLKRVARRVVGPGDVGLRERLAAAEHARWMASRIMHGWRLGPRDDEAKLHPNIVPYEALSETQKDYDRHNVDEAWSGLAMRPARDNSGFAPPGAR